MINSLEQLHKTFITANTSTDCKSKIRKKKVLETGLDQDLPEAFANELAIKVNKDSKHRMHLNADRSDAD